MDQISAINPGNPAKVTAPSEGGVNRSSSLEDDDPAVWLDQFLKTNPDILNDQEEIANSRKGENNDFLPESENPEGHPHHHHLEARDDGESDMEKDRIFVPSGNLHGDEPSLKKMEGSEERESRENEDVDDNGRSESPYALMVQSQDELPNGEEESEEIDSEGGKALPKPSEKKSGGCMEAEELNEDDSSRSKEQREDDIDEDYPSPPEDQIVDDDHKKDGKYNEGDEPLPRPSGPSDMGSNDTIQGGDRNALTIKPSQDDTGNGDLETDERPSAHGSNSSDNQPGSGESNADTSPSPEIPSSPSPPGTDIEALAGIQSNQSSWTYASYLIAHFNILYCLWISPRKHDGSNPRGKLNFVPFVLVTLLAILSSLEHLKNQFAYGDHEQNLGLYFLTIGYYFNTFLLRLCFVRLLGFNYQAISRIMDAIIQIGGRSSTKMVAVIVWVPWTLTILIAISVPILYAMSNLYDDWEMADLILGNAYEFSKTLFLWTDKNYSNDTSYLLDTYTSNISTTTVTMGVSSYFIKTVGYLEKYIVIDTVLVLAFTMFSISGSLRNDLERARENPTLDNRKILWESYLSYRDLSIQINDCCWLFLLLTHLENLLFVAYFSLDHVFLREAVSVGVVKAPIHVKLIALYYWAFQSSSISSKIHKWVQFTFRGPDALFIEGSEPVTVASVLDELSTYPVGIGTGLFFVNESFIFRFIGAIISYFACLSQAAQEMMRHE